MAECSVIDRAALDRMLELVGGDADMFAELMNTFFEDAPTFIKELHAALAQGSAERMRITAHSLKSNSASFGALALADQCRALEAQAKMGILQGVADQIAQIEKEYALAHEELKS